MMAEADCAWVDALSVAAPAERGDAVNDRVYKGRFDLACPPEG